MQDSGSLSQYASLSFDIDQRNPHQNGHKDRDIVKQCERAVTEIAVANRLRAERDQKVQEKKKTQKIKLAVTTANITSNGKKKTNKLNERAKSKDGGN